MEVNLSQNQWKETAELLNLSVEETQKRYNEALGKMGDKAITINHKSLQAKAAEKDFSYPIDIDFYGILNLKGELTFVSGTDWSVVIKAEVSLIGIKIIDIDQTLDASNPEFCAEVNVALAKASLCLGYKDSCVYIKGEACYWAISWSCADFDENLVCF